MAPVAECGHVRINFPYKLVQSRVEAPDNGSPLTIILVNESQNISHSILVVCVFDVDLDDLLLRQHFKHIFKEGECVLVAFYPLIKSLFAEMQRHIILEDRKLCRQSLDNFLPLVFEGAPLAKSIEVCIVADKNFAIFRDSDIRLYDGSLFVSVQKGLHRVFRSFVGSTSVRKDVALPFFFLRQLQLLLFGVKNLGVLQEVPRTPIPKPEASPEFGRSSFHKARYHILY